MKNQFSGYFPLPEATIKKIWKEGVFSFDANFLLNFYRYSKETRAEVFKIVGAINDRTWVSHQAALEFLRNRLNVIAEQDKTYDAARKDLKEIEERFKTSSRHPFVNDDLLKQMSALFSKLDKELEDRKNEFIKLGDSDDVQDELVKLLDGKVGSPYGDKRLNEIYQEGERRYKDKIPPGFRDQVKEGEKRKFGDLILWFQLIDKATTEKKPIIFITDDAKDDWWWKSSNKTIGPRPELVDEIKAKAGVDFYIYSSDRFMQFSHKYLNQNVEKSAIEEIKEIRRSSAEGIRSYEMNVDPNIAKYIADLNAARNFAAHLDPSFFAGISGVVNNWARHMSEMREQLSPLTVALLSGDPLLTHLKATNQELSYTQQKENVSDSLKVSVDETTKSSIETKPEPLA